MPGACRLGDKAKGIDSHGCIACPHNVSGPVTQGSPDTIINGKPAARKGDSGIHGICCGPNRFVITGGSRTVSINGKPAARKGDMTIHCGGVGKMEQSSSNVIIGNGLGRVFKMAAEQNAPFVFEDYDGEMTWGLPSEDYFYGAPPKYGPSKLPCGGLDATDCKIYRDHATQRKDNQTWRRPLVKDGKVYPMEGTSGKAQAIPKLNEAGSVVLRENKSKNYKIKKDNQGFPAFTIFETYLDDRHINSGNEFEHFKAVNVRLGKLLRENKSLVKKMGLSEKQANHFMKENPSRDCARGLTWHHHQETGKMQLVHRKLHRRFGHVGGMEIWGGGRP